jgi:hypothetical protein
MWRRLSRLSPEQRQSAIEQEADQALKRAGLELRTCAMRPRRTASLRRSG